RRLCALGGAVLLTAARTGIAVPAPVRLPLCTSCSGWGVTRVPADGRPRHGVLADDPGSIGPITVPDLLARSGHGTARTSEVKSARARVPVVKSGRRVAARQAVVEVRRHRIRRTCAALLTMLVALFASAAAYYVGLFFYLDRTIDRVDALAPDAPGIMSPQAQDATDNFLIVGTETSGSDVHVTSALIAHLTPGRDGVVLVSLPLTAYTDVPACPIGEQPGLADPYGGSLASSYDTAGAGCLIRTVQQLSGMRMDHYVELNLERLPGMVEALGGIPVCFPAELTTGDRGGVPAGSSVLDSDQVRAILADVDPARDPTGQLATDRQRLLLTSTLREALRPANLVNPVAVTGFVNEAANGLTLDTDTTLGELKDLGDMLGEFTAEDTVQTSVPLTQLSYEPVDSAQSYALIDDLASRELFRAIISDSSLPDPGDPGADGGAPATIGTAEAVPPAPETAPPPAPDPNALTVAPQQITVNVYNGIGTRGLATEASEQLSAHGFGIGEIENQVTGDEASVVRYPPGQLQAARTVAASVPNSVLQEGTTSGGLIDLVVGSSFDGVVQVIITPPLPPSPTATPSATPTVPAPSPASPQSCG
ncbi:MAG: LCP family protein, partial [Actinomycetota bacterium]|nr:LCP family protein [Actinomycetota bacterium]